MNANYEANKALANQWLESRQKAAGTERLVQNANQARAGPVSQVPEELLAALAQRVIRPDRHRRILRKLLCWKDWLLASHISTFQR